MFSGPTGSFSEYRFWVKENIQHLMVVFGVICFICHCELKTLVSNENFACPEISFQICDPRWRNE